LQATASGGVPPYAFLWDVFSTIGTPPTNPEPGHQVLVNGNTPTPTVSPLVTTVFRVTVTDAIGLVATDFVKITVLQPLVVNAGSNRVIPSGTTLELAADVSGGLLPYTFAWTADVADGGFLSSTTAARVRLQPVEDTIYTCTVTDAVGSVVSDEVTVTLVGGTVLPGTGVINPPADNGTDDGGGTGTPGGTNGGGNNGGTASPPPQQSPNDGASPIALPFCGASISSGFLAINALALLALRRRRRG
jgi:hypothetical protein